MDVLYFISFSMLTNHFHLPQIIIIYIISVTIIIINGPGYIIHISKLTSGYILRLYISWHTSCRIFPLFLWWWISFLRKTWVIGLFRAKTWWAFTFLTKFGWLIMELLGCMPDNGFWCYRYWFIQKTISFNSQSSFLQTFHYFIWLSITINLLIKTICRFYIA